MAVETAGDFRVFWMLGLLTCCLFTNANGQGVQIDSTTSFGFEISWTVLGAWDYYVISLYLGPGEEAPGYPMNTTSTSAQLIHLYPDTAYEIVVLPKLNDGEEGPWNSTSGTTDVSHIEVTVTSKTFIMVVYTLPEDEMSSNQQIRLGHFGSTLQTFGNQPFNSVGNVVFPSFPAVSPGDLLYASNAPSSDPTNYLNEIHFRYPPSPPQNVTVNPSPGDAFEVTFELPATGGNYDGFRIRVNDEVRETLMGSATTSVIINGLAPNTLYTFNVTSFVGIGGDEAESEMFTETRSLGPSMPDITVLNTTESSIALGLQSGHGILDEYIITIQCMDATQDHCVCEEEHRVPGNAKSFVIDDLRPSVEYGISVVAWAGSELAENSVEVTLEERTLWIPDNRFTVLDQTPDSVILAWTVSGPANITMERLMPSGYVLNATYVYDSCFSSNVLEVSGLEPVTIYRFTMPDDVSILIRTDPPSIESCSVETTSSGYTFTWSALAPGSNDGYQVTVTDSQGGLVQEEAVPPTDDPEVVKIRVPPETELTLAVNSWLAADDINNFPQQFGAVPCIQNAVTESLVAGEVSPTNVTIDEIPFVVGNASALQGFEGYAFAVEPPGPVVSFDANSLTGVYSNVLPGQLYTITSTIVGTDVTFTLKERAKPLPPVDGSSPSAGVTSVRLQWGTPSGIVTFYRVTINPTLDTDQNFIEVMNLLPGMDYNVSIVAISGTGLYQQISDPIEFQVITDNLTTGELVFVDVTSSSMTAIWPDTGSPSYTPIILIGTGTNTLSPPIPVGNMLIVTDGVKSSQIYHFTIYDAVFIVVANNAVRTNPETPQPPILTSVGPFSLSFEWAPTNTTFSSYRMYYAPFSFRRELVSTIPSNSLDLTYSQGCLRPNTEYVFEVETVLDAADGFGEQTSDSAQSISITTHPREPGTIDVEEVTSTSISITWTEIAGITDYIVNLNLASNNTELFSEVIRSSLKASFSGLMPGEEYIIKIELQCDVEVLFLRQFTFPNPPTNLRTTMVAAQSITVSWDPPSEGGSDTYVITYNITGGQPPSPHTVSSSETSVTFSNLTPLTEYFFTIVNIWESLPSRSELTRATTSAQTLSLAVTPKDNTEFTVSWEDLDTKAFDQYCVRYEPYEAQANRQQESFPVDRSIRSARFYGLDPGQEYTVFVTSCSNFSEATSHASERISFRLDPAAIAEIRIMDGSLGPRAVTLEWTHPEGIRGLYEVTLDPADEGSVHGDELPVNITGVMTSIEILNLAAGKGYTVGISTISGDKRSEDTTFLFYTLPLEPVRAVFTWVTEDSVTLQWSRPESQLVGYEIMYEDGSGPYSPINVFDRISLQLERTIMGLMDGPGVEVNITTLAGAGMAQTRSNPVKISPSQNDNNEPH